uniref:TRAP transporter small permease n=1 Tax=Roseovarius indicus TaxID=540747 RepID=UPI003B51B06D
MNSAGAGWAKAGHVLWDGLLRLQRLIMLAAIVFTTTAIMIEVVMRYIFSSSIIGVQELAAYSALWLYFSGAAYGTYTRVHITAELTHLVFRSPRQMLALKFLTNLISFGLLAYIVPWGWRYLEWGLTRHEQSSSTFLGSTYDIVFFQSAIFYGIVLMAFYFFVETLQCLRALLSGDDTRTDLLTDRPEADTWI